MEQLTFFDMKIKKRFTTDEYKIINKSGRRFAVAISPSGITCYRIMGKE